VVGILLSAWWPPTACAARSHLISQRFYNAGAVPGHHHAVRLCSSGCSGCQRDCPACCIGSDRDAFGHGGDPFGLVKELCPCGSLRCVFAGRRNGAGLGMWGLIRNDQLLGHGMMALDPIRRVVVPPSGSA